MDGARKQRQGGSRQARQAPENVADFELYSNWEALDLAAYLRSGSFRTSSRTPSTAPSNKSVIQLGWRPSASTRRLCRPTLEWRLTTPATHPSPTIESIPTPSPAIANQELSVTAPTDRRPKRRQKSPIS